MDEMFWLHLERAHVVHLYGKRQWLNMKGGGVKSGIVVTFERHVRAVMQQKIISTFIIISTCSSWHVTELLTFISSLLGENKDSEFSIIYKIVDRAALRSSGDTCWTDEGKTSRLCSGLIQFWCQSGNEELLLSSCNYHSSSLSFLGSVFFLPRGPLAALQAAREAPAVEFTQGSVCTREPAGRLNLGQRSRCLRSHRAPPDWLPIKPGCVNSILDLNSAFPHTRWLPPAVTPVNTRKRTVWKRGM